MTPEQKAAELINKMYYTQSSPTSWVQAKQCALIAIDEILEVARDAYHEEVLAIHMIYWDKVKQEIEKL